MWVNENTEERLYLEITGEKLQVTICCVASKLNNNTTRARKAETRIAFPDENTLFGTNLARTSFSGRDQLAGNLLDHLFCGDFDVGTGLLWARNNLGRRDAEPQRTEVRKPFSLCC
jgi:hypothetical protein